MVRVIARVIAGVITAAHGVTIESHNEDVQCGPGVEPYPVALTKALQEAGDSSFYLQIVSGDAIPDVFHSHVMYADSRGKVRVLVSITESSYGDKFITRACVGACGSCTSVQAISFMHFYSLFMDRKWNTYVHNTSVNSVFFPPWTSEPARLVLDKAVPASSVSETVNIYATRDVEGNVFQMWSNRCKPLWLSQYDLEGALNNTMHYYQPNLFESLVSAACTLFFDIDGS